MRVVFAADHAGFELKEHLKTLAESWGHEVLDCGADAYEKNDDYPDFVSCAAIHVSNDPDNVRAVVVGGSGQGEAIVANRHLGVRAAVFYGPVVPKQDIEAEGTTSKDPFQIVRLARTHNDVNVLSLGARFLDQTEAEEAMRLFLGMSFSGIERHARRNAKTDALRRDIS